MNAGFPTDGMQPGDAKRVAPRSPRAALEPEYMPEPKRPSRRARHPLIIAGNAIFTIILLVAIVGGVAYSYGKHMLEAPGPLDREKIVNIPRGLGLRDIADLLARENVIEQPWVFIPAVVVLKAKDDLKYGEYKFTKQMTVRETIETIIEGKVIQHAITIPEGLTSEQIIARLAEIDFLAGNIREIPKEGTLLPDTYNFPRGATREQALQRMQQAHRRVLQEVWERRNPEVPVSTPEALVTLASIVEKETGRADERSRVAAVFCQPHSSEDEAAVGPHDHLRAGRGQGDARAADHALRDRAADAVQYLRDHGPAARADRQSGPRLARGDREPVAHQGNLLRRGWHRRACVRRKSAAAPAERHEAPAIRAAASADDGDAGSCDPVRRTGAASQSIRLLPCRATAPAAAKGNAKQKTKAKTQ